IVGSFFAVLFGAGAAGAGAAGAGAGAAAAADAVLDGGGTGGLASPARGVGFSLFGCAAAGSGDVPFCAGAWISFSLIGNTAASVGAGATGVFARGGGATGGGGTGFGRGAGLISPRARATTSARRQRSPGSATRQRSAMVAKGS